MSKKFKEPENFLVSLKEYRRLKSIVKAMEATNYNQIIVVTCDGKEGWRDISEHSALIYYYAVREKLTSKNKNKFMSDDSSFYTKYDIGYMRTKGLNAVRDNLIKLGLYKSERAESKYIHVFELTRTFTEAELDEYYKKEVQRRLDETLPIDSEVVDPYLWHKMAHLATMLHQKANNNLAKLTGQVNGARIIALADELLKNYLRASDVEKDGAPNAEKGHANNSDKNHANDPEKGHDAKVLAFLNTMQNDLNELTLEIKVISATGQWNPHICVNIMSEINAVKTSLDIDIAKLTAPQKPQTPKQPQKPAQNPATPPEPKQLTLGDILDKGAKS